MACADRIVEINTDLTAEHKDELDLRVWKGRCGVKVEKSVVQCTHTHIQHKLPQSATRK